MAKAYILYNPLSGSGNIQNDLDVFEVVLDEELVFADITEAGIGKRVRNALREDDYIILCGGDGTLHHFVNDRVLLDIQNEIYYYPCGNRNDFAAEFHREFGCNPFPVTEHLTKLPTVTWKGKSQRFLNGIGFAAVLPGNQRSAHLRDHDPTGMTVLVDGTEFRFDKTWLGVTMYGTHWEGLIPAPQQKRGNDQLSFAVIHSCGRTHAAMLLSALRNRIFPKYEKHLTVLSGREITVSLDAPRTLQVDGETTPDVITYTASRRNDVDED